LAHFCPQRVVVVAQAHQAVPAASVRAVTYRRQVVQAVPPAAVRAAVVAQDRNSALVVLVVPAQLSQVAAGALVAVLVELARITAEVRRLVQPLHSAHQTFSA
jgi:hypothetical protein